MNVDVVCVGFGPAMGGFLTTLSRRLVKEDGTPAIESAVMPGMPLQVVCYERADDIGFGVSGVVTKARGIRESFPDLDPSQIPMATPVAHEEMVYLLDPIGVSRRPATLRVADALIRGFKWLLTYERHALRFPYIPGFLRKEGGLLLSIGQFNQWVGGQLMMSGTAQLWPGMPVAGPLIEKNQVVGVRLVDQGTDKDGNPSAGFMPGMDIRAALTVVGDGPIGPVGRAIDEHFGMPRGHHRRDWAVGVKMVVDLPEGIGLKPGTVIHTFGYPEPEIFGFMYVYRENAAALGIFVPCWFGNPARTSYRYLQHWMMHPYLWRYLEGARLRSWGAKTLLESGKRGEPFLVGDGYARIGEDSGSTNVLAGAGVDEAWTTGTQLAEGVIELLKEGQALTKENLERAYVKRRRSSWVEREARVAAKSRDGFNHGVVAGLIGMGLAGLTRGFLWVPGKSVPPHKQIRTLNDYYKGRISPDEIERIRAECTAKGIAISDPVMDRCGWPPIPFDGKLLISHQDAMLLGGKVQAPAGYADHVRFISPHLCESCREKVCIELCSGQAITPNPQDGMPVFDREKCIHCGTCFWSCSKGHPEDREKTNVDFRAGAGGLHSAEN
jgi:electron-transferring-flavoprotein dehydrogenase